jgi:hypothetical protein
MKTRLREMVPADVPILKKKLYEQNGRDGTSYGFPQVFDANGKRMPDIVLALTAEGIETGEVVQGHVYERTIEHSCYGVDPEATLCSMREQDAVFYLLRQRGFKDFHIFVPPGVVGQLESGLDRILGMSKTGMCDFYRRLDADENEIVRQWYRTREVDNVA